MNSFSDIFESRQNYAAYLKKLIARYRYVVFYGCRMIFSEISANWRNLIGQDICLICDDDPAKRGKTFDGMPLFEKVDL